MKIVDKYGLAKCSYGTPFYNLYECSNGYFQVREGLKILTSHTSYTYTDNKSFFNGVCPLEPDIYDEENYGGIFTKEMAEKAKFELYEDDDDSNNYDDEDRFLILSKEEFKIILDELQNYYNLL